MGRDDACRSKGHRFVLTYPEIVTGKRTTPRSLVQFFDQISTIPDLRQDMDIVHALAKSTFDEPTVSAFMAFIQDDLSSLLHPADILDAPDFKTVAAEFENLAAGKGGEKRLDRISAICTRLFLALKAKDYQPGERHRDNLVKFMLQESLPKDLKMSLYMDLMREASAEAKEMHKDKRLAVILLVAM